MGKNKKKEEKKDQVDSKSRQIKKDKKDSPKKDEVKQPKEEKQEGKKEDQVKQQIGKSIVNYFKQAQPQIQQQVEQKPKTFFDFFEKDKKYNNMGFSTRAIHCGNDPLEAPYGSIAPVIDLSTTFAQPAPGQPLLFDYSRCSHPTRLQLERNLASMAKTNYAFVVNSGMSAHVSIISLVKHNEHILCFDDVYGGTQRYLRRILNEKQNIDVTFADFTNIKNVKEGIKPNTRVVWAESPSNPTLKICDIKAIAELCHQQNILFVVDNTFMSPFLSNPIEFGADIVVESCTKYIGGHSDLIQGVICFNDKQLYDDLFFQIKTLGTGAAPFDCYLALRGTKTLAIRMERAQQNAQTIAKFLDEHPKIEKVVYPGLQSHPQYKLCKQQCKGPGAMISLYIKGDINMADRFLKAVKVFTLAESLGGVESLIENPALMTHGSVPPEQRKILGIDDNFIRVSVGIEDIDDLIQDLRQALDKA